MSDDTIEFPFQHPACSEAKGLFRSLAVYSEEDYRTLSRRDRYVWDICWFESEVMNGGVDQYLYNSTGDHYLECLDALAAIGAKQAYSLLKQACDLFPERKPSFVHETRQSQLRELVDGSHVDDLISGEEIEVDLYQRLLDFYRRAK